MRTLFPKPIVPGACFAVVAPSSQVDSKLLKLGEKKLGRAGFTLHCDANVLKSHRFWAGGDASRSAQFIAAIRSNTNNALWCAAVAMELHGFCLIWIVRAWVLPFGLRESCCWDFRTSPRFISTYGKSHALPLCMRR